MCDFLTIASGVATLGAGVMQGIGAKQAGDANAAMAKAQGKQALVQSQAEASNLAQRGAYALGGMRRDLAGTGNLSGLDLVADSATNLSMDIERIKHGGRAAKAGADYEASYYRSAGRGALIGGLVNGVVGAGTQLLSGMNNGASLADKYPVINTAKSFMPSLAAKY